MAFTATVLRKLALAGQLLLEAVYAAYHGDTTLGLTYDRRQQAAGRNLCAP